MYPSAGLRLPNDTFPSGLPTDHVFISLLQILHTLQPPGICHTTYTQQAVKTIKLHSIQFYPSSYFFFPLRAKYCPQQSTIEKPKSSLWAG